METRCGPQSSQVRRSNLCGFVNLAARASISSQKRSGLAAMPSITNVGGSLTSAVALTLIAWAVRFVRARNSRKQDEKELHKQLGRFHASISAAALQVLVCRCVTKLDLNSDLSSMRQCIDVCSRSRRIQYHTLLSTSATSKSQSSTLYLRSSARSSLSQARLSQSSVASKYYCIQNRRSFDAQSTKYSTHFKPRSHGQHMHKTIHHTLGWNTCWSLSETTKKKWSRLQRMQPNMALQGQRRWQEDCRLLNA